MRLALSTFGIALLSSIAYGQDFVFYKFDSGCTTEVINYASGASALTANGMLESTSSVSPWIPGVYGSAFDGGGSGHYNRVRTGWDPGAQPITGDLTIAFFMKEATPPTSLSYMMGAPSGGFRLFTNGVAGRGLYRRVILASGGNGVNASIANDFYLPASAADIQTMAAASSTRASRASAAPRRWSATAQHRRSATRRTA